MPRQKPAGIPEGAEVVFLTKPFGGWVSSRSGVATASHYDASVEGVQGAIEKEQLNQYAESDGITLFRLEKFGHIAPGHVYTAITDGSTLINQLPLNGDVNSSGDSFVVLKNGRIVKCTGGITTAASYDVYNTSPGSSLPSGNHSGHVVAAAGTINPDMIIMRDLAGTPTGSAPVEYVIWSWEDGTDADLSYYKASDGGTIVDGWVSNMNSNTPLLPKGVPLKLVKGPDGNIYVTSGPYVRQIVVNGALNSSTLGNVLPIGAGWTAIGIESFKNYVAIIASSTPAITGRGKVRVFLWDGTTTTINGVTSTAAQFIYDIPDSIANGIFFDGAILYALTAGRNNTSKIWEYVGSRGFKKVFENGLIGTSTIPLQGSMEAYQESLMIGSTKNSQAHLFRFYGGGFHDEGVITDGTNAATSVGMVKNLFQGQLFMGVNYSSSYKIYYQSSFTKYQTNATIRTILYTAGVLGRRMYPLGFKGTLSRLILYLSQWGTGASLTISVFKDYTTYGVAGSTNDLSNILIDTNTGTPNSKNHYAFPVGTTEMDISDISIPNLSSFYVIVTFNHASVTNTAAIIRSMIMYWTPSQ